MKFALDPRSLACMRIGLALIVIFESLYSLTHLHYFYSEYGFLPINTLLELFPPGSFSVFLLSRWWGFTAALLVLLGAAAVALLVGYRTRWATFLCWLLLLGLQLRNPLVLYGGDSWLLQTLFWSMFLPLDGRWSVDSNPSSLPLAGPAALGFLIQTSLIYFLSGWEKLNPSWTGGTAIVRFLQCEELRGPLATQLLYHPEFLSATARFIPWFEMVAAVFIVLPFARGRLRALTLGSLGVFHLLLMLGLQLRAFSWVGVSVILGLMPSVVWGEHRGGPGEREPAPKWSWILLLLPLNTVILNLNLPLGELPSRFGALLGQRERWALFAHPPDVVPVLEIEVELQDGRRIPLDGKARPRLTEFTWKSAYSDLRFRQYGHNLARMGKLPLLTAFAGGISEKIHRRQWDSPPKTVHLLRRRYVVRADFEEEPAGSEEILHYEIPDKSFYSPRPPPLPPAGS